MPFGKTHDRSRGDATIVCGGRRQTQHSRTQPLTFYLGTYPTCIVYIRISCPRECIESRPLRLRPGPSRVGLSRRFTGRGAGPLVSPVPGAAWVNIALSLTRALTPPPLPRCSHGRGDVVLSQTVSEFRTSYQTLMMGPPGVCAVACRAGGGRGRGVVAVVWLSLWVIISG